MEEAWKGLSGSDPLPYDHVTNKISQSGKRLDRWNWTTVGHFCSRIGKMEEKFSLV